MLTWMGLSSAAPRVMRSRLDGPHRYLPLTTVASIHGFFAGADNIVSFFIGQWLSLA